VRERVGGKGRGVGRGKRGVMTQSLYAHINKGKKNYGIIFAAQNKCCFFHYIKNGRNIKYKL
jgi:hypothetical protein